MKELNIVKLTNILEIVDIKFLQDLQDFFAKTMGVALVTVSNKNRLTLGSNSSDFCSKYTRGSKLGCKNCDKCHLKLEKAAMKKGKPIMQKCRVGLANFAIPILVEGRHLATVIGGQVSTDTLDENRLKKLAKEFGIDEYTYLEAAKELNFLSTEKFQTIMKSLNHILNSIVSIAYANFQLAELGIDYKIPRDFSIEQWLFLSCDKIKSPISDREFEVLRLIVLGKSNIEIAKELFISVHTAKAHVSSILEKFGVEDRVQVAVKAIREGLI